jgi:TNF receptor-associated factor 4
MVDKGRARIINGLQVSCINKGCQWIGQLKCLPAHLNRGEREGECQYELVECKCHVKVKRIDAENHENNECSQRPYQCEYCGLVASYEWITQQHYRKCNKYPVPCPNNCQVTLVREEVEYHKSNECPLRLVECEFEWAGCHQIIPHKDIHQHRYDSHDDHINLVRLFYEEQIQSLEECKEKLHNDYENLIRENEEENKDLISQINTLIHKTEIKFITKYDALNSKIKEKDKEILERDKEILERDKEILERAVHHYH